MTTLNVTMDWGDILTSSLISIIIVFSALIILLLAFKLTGSFSVRKSRRRMEKTDPSEKSVLNPHEIPASEIAAIAMALHLFYDDVHDKESNIITIKRIERRYSPWNSKIYGLTNLNR